MNATTSVIPNALQSLREAPLSSSLQQTDTKLYTDNILQQPKVKTRHLIDPSNTANITKLPARFLKSGDFHMESRDQIESCEITLWVLRKATAKRNKAVLERRVFKLPMGIEKMTGRFFDVYI